MNSSFPLVLPLADQQFLGVIGQFDLLASVRSVTASRQNDHRKSDRQGKQRAWTMMNLEKFATEIGENK